MHISMSGQQSEFQLGINLCSDDEARSSLLEQNAAVDYIWGQSGLPGAGRSQAQRPYTAPVITVHDAWKGKLRVWHSQKDSGSMGNTEAEFQRILLSSEDVTGQCLPRQRPVVTIDIRVRTSLVTWTSWTRMAHHGRHKPATLW